MKEEITEQGIVISSENGIAEVALLESDNCEECSAKIICKPKADNEKILTVIDEFNASPGDEVSISIEGKELFKASLFLYGLPLIILVLGIYLGMNIFPQDNKLELYSFLSGLAAMSIYFISFFLISKLSSAKENFPKIKFITKKLVM